MLEYLGKTVILLEYEYSVVFIYICTEYIFGDTGLLAPLANIYCMFYNLCKCGELFMCHAVLYIIIILTAYQKV